jgi:hypothetical protein
MKSKKQDNIGVALLKRSGVWRLIVFALFLLIKSPKQSLGALFVFAPFLIIIFKNCSSNGDLSLCQILCLYHYTFRSYQH